jgi:hypothetical protein
MGQYVQKQADKVSFGLIRVLCDGFDSRQWQFNAHRLHRDQFSQALFNATMRHLIAAIHGVFAPG